MLRFLRGLLGFLRGIVVYERRAEFVSLFGWLALGPPLWIGYSLLVRGEPFGASDGLFCLWSGLNLFVLLGLKRSWPLARGVGVASLLALAVAGLGLAAFLGRISFATLFSFVILGLAGQLALRDFEGRELRESLEKSFLITLLLQSKGTQAPEAVFAKRLEDALSYHLRRHATDYAVCEDTACQAARALGELLARSEEEVAAFAREQAQGEHESQHLEAPAAPEAPAGSEPNEDAPGGEEPPSASSV